MKKFFQKPIGKRVLIALFMLAAAVGAGFLLQGIAGPESEMWQRGVFCVACFGTGLAALGFCIFSWMGLLGGYGFVLGYFLVVALPEVLPEPWNRIFLMIALAFLFGGSAFWKLRKKKQATEKTEEAFEEELEEELEIPDNMLVVHFFGSDRNYQLIRTPGELRAYRVGGEIRGIDEALLQDPQKPLRPLGKKDLSFPLDETFRVSMQERYNNQWNRDELVVTLRSGRKKHRMNSFGSDEQLRTFFAQCTPNRTEKKSRVEKEPQTAPNPDRVAALRKVSVGLLIAMLAINLPWLFLEVPYKLFAVLALPLPLVCLAICCIFPYDTTLADTKRAESTRASFVYPLMLSAVLPTIRALRDFKILDWGKLLLFAGIALAILLAVFLLLYREWRTRKALIFSLLFPLLIFSFSCTIEVNYLFDTTEPDAQIGVVEDMRISGRRKSKSYYLELRLPDGSELDLSVSSSRYNETEIGDEMEVYFSDGALGIPYAYD